MSETSQLQYCAKCGAVLSGYAADRLCAACLLESAILEAETSADPRAPATPLLSFNDYELLEEIARGGMGVVYRARQISLNRTVAIKMILGGHLANAAEMKRFRAEAETVAQLQHPNIVAIHEVGEHAGQPFFSMDLVEGRNLAQLVRDEPLPSRKAAAYLKTIAEAVQFAHSRGVLHRDLKPSNILIDENDQPRITDFGLAKRLTDPQLSTNDPQLTQTGQVLGSPSFIPPEQAAGQKDKLGPTSDVYSLGAILYHCLTARPPFVAESLTQTLRMVAEQEPVSPRLLNASVPRDLETICLKCLEKDPRRRYAAAQELADELGRFLCNEPIHARPVGMVLKVHRWCVRNKPLAISGTAILALLLVVAIGSPIAALRIDRERVRAEEALRNEAQQRRQAEGDRKKAETEAAKSDQVAQFLKDLLGGVGPSVALGRDKTLLQEILDKTSARVSKDFTNQPEVEAELRNTLGEVYYAIGQIAKAEGMHRTALELRSKLWGDETLAVAASQHNLGLALYAQAEGPEAEALLRAALATQRKLIGNENLAVAESLNSLGLELAEHSQEREAETLFREALAIRRKLLPGEHPDLARSLNNLATTLSNEGKSAEAETAAREALAMQRKLLDNDEHPDIAISLYALATALFHQGKFSDAETVQREGVAIQRKLLGAHPDLAKSLWRLAEVLAHEGKLAEAETVQREALAMLHKLYGSGHPALDWPPYTLAQILRMQGKPIEAESMWRETLEVGKRKADKNNWLVISSLNSLADLLRDQRRTDEADQLYREALAIASRTAVTNVDRALCWSSYGLICTARDQDRLEEAESVVRTVMAKAGKAWVNYSGAWELTADILTRRGKYHDAEHFLTISPTLAVVDKYGNARPARGDFRARTGRWDDAAADFSEAVALEPDNVENYHRLAPLLVQSGRLDAYREHCRKSVERFANTTNPAIAERVVKDSLILPASGVDLETVSKLANVLISAGTNHSGINWIRATTGLAEYRQGRWASAVDWTEQALTSLGVNERDVEAYLVLAMAKQQLNQPGEARANLAKAVEIVETKLPKLESGDIGELWGDWIIARALLSEAKTTIEEQPPASARP